MLPSKIAFVDIETTGTSIYHDRVIEIGVIRVENNKVVDTFQTLINPEGHVPAEIEILTGINSFDLEKAPTFSRVYKDIQNILKDCVFCAHNVRFDYGFLKNEFHRQEISFSAKNLCTVKLSRKLFPEFRSHSLDAIINRFDIKCLQRHRAYDDAAVIWEFYRKLLKLLPKDTFEESVNWVMKKPSTPIFLKSEILDKLPETPGVYIFYGENGSPLYVGKSINIKNRVLSHFSSDHTSSKELKISQQIRSIETIKTAGELGALLTESKIIKDLSPLYNRKLRRSRKMVVIYRETDSKGYSTIRFAASEEIDPENLDNILGVFRSVKQAKEYLILAAKENYLCEKLLGVQKSSGTCFGYHLGKCYGACADLEKPEKYNARFSLAFYKNKLRRWPFSGPIKFTERNSENSAAEIHVFDKWCYIGTLTNEEDSEKVYKTAKIKFDLDTYKILVRFLYLKSTSRTITT